MSKPWKPDPFQILVSVTDEEYAKMPQVTAEERAESLRPRSSDVSPVCRQCGSASDERHHDACPSVPRAEGEAPPSEPFVSGYNAGRSEIANRGVYDINAAWATYLRYGGRASEAAPPGFWRCSMCNGDHPRGVSHMDATRAAEAFLAGRASADAKPFCFGCLAGPDDCEDLVPVHVCENCKPKLRGKAVWVDPTVTDGDIRTAMGTDGIAIQVGGFAASNDMPNARTVYAQATADVPTCECPNCQGTGTEPDGFQVTEKTCVDCRGTGRVEWPLRRERVPPCPFLGCVLPNHGHWCEVAEEQRLKGIAEKEASFNTNALPYEMPESFRKLRDWADANPGHPVFGPTPNACAAVPLSSGEVCWRIQNEVDHATDETRPGLLAAYEVVLGMAGRASPSSWPAPIPMILHCTDCWSKHLDEGEWATRPHKTHQCQSCGSEWRPANVPTVGVSALPFTRKDSEGDAP